MRYSGIGGQAVMEGVMMKNGDDYAIAVRTPDQKIIVENFASAGLFKNKTVKNIPVIRGVVNFIESLTLGMKALTYSASFFEDEKEKKEQNEKKENFVMGLTVAFSVVLAVGIFMILPYGISLLFEKVFTSHWVIALLEGVLRLLIFLGYVAGISLMPDIKRV